MHPPFSSNPKKAPRSIIVLETSTLPTLVRITLALRFAATTSTTWEELIGSDYRGVGGSLKKIVGKERTGLVAPVDRAILVAEDRPVPVSVVCDTEVCANGADRRAEVAQRLRSGLRSPSRKPAVDDRVDRHDLAPEHVEQDTGAARHCAPFPGSTTTENFLPEISLVVDLREDPLQVGPDHGWFWPGGPHVLPVRPVIERSRKMFSIFCSSSLLISTPSGPMTLSPLYSAGLWEAVTMTPPLYPSALGRILQGRRRNQARLGDVPPRAHQTRTSRASERASPESLPSLPTRMSPSEKYVPMHSAKLDHELEVGAHTWYEPHPVGSEEPSLGRHHGACPRLRIKKLQEKTLW